MKSLYAAGVLFISVIVFLTVNYFMINSLLDFTEKEFEKVPEKLEEIENMTENELQRVKESLEKIKDKWDDKENYVCMSLDHNVSRDFMGDLISALSFFESEEYPEFLAQKESAKDSIEHMKFDEGFKIGNVL